MDVVNAFLIGALEFAEIYLILWNVPVLGELTLLQASLVFALANLGFSVADLIFGQLDGIPDQIRLGRLEALLVRPMPLMVQLILSDFQLRRLGRGMLALVILVVVLVRLDVAWTPGTIYLLVMSPVYGAAIFGALFALAGGIQFFLIDGAEFTSSFVYGGAYAAQLPGSALIKQVRLLFTFLIPATVTGYLPALVILGLDGPPFLPAWLGWCGPAFAAWAWLLALAGWRTGVRKFTGAGG